MFNFHFTLFHFVRQSVNLSVNGSVANFDETQIGSCFSFWEPLLVAESEGIKLYRTNRTLRKLESEIRKKQAGLLKTGTDLGFSRGGWEWIFKKFSKIWSTFF